jgi:EAL domain-containing protein (putative c-di-GMP-specific phosphodiesterase class I)
VRTLAEIGVDYVQGFAVSRSQAPEKMLSAASSASFIQNEELALLVRTLGAEAAQPAVAAVARVHDLH